MPSCPGCGAVLTYAELSTHIRTCKWVWSDAPARESVHVDHLVREVRQLERRVYEVVDDEPIFDDADDGDVSNSSDRRE